jgi:hypothetical protein
MTGLVGRTILVLGMDKKSIGRGVHSPLTCVNPSSHFPAMAPSQADRGLFDLGQKARISLD